MNKRITSLLSYLSILFWLLAYLVGDRENAKFYLNQSLTVNLFSTVLALSINLLHGTLIAVILSIFELVVSIITIIGIYHAYKQDGKPNPILGGIQLLK